MAALMASFRGHAPATSETDSVALKEAFSSSLRKIAKDSVLSVTGERYRVHGIGIELPPAVKQLTETRAAVSHRVQEIDQSRLQSWVTKLRAGAISTELSQPQKSGAVRSNAELVAHLKSTAQPGDILFVSGGGNGQSFLLELFDNALRLLCGRHGRDARFPFTHVMIVTESKDILDISSKGVLKGSFEDTFIKSSYYDSVAIGRLTKSPANVRQDLAAHAEQYLSGKRFNLRWILLHAPISLLRSKLFNVPLDDASASESHCVCIDVVTEPAKKLVKEGKVELRSISKATTPLELFSDRRIAIVEAATLHRNH